MIILLKHIGDTVASRKAQSDSLYVFQDCGSYRKLILVYFNVCCCLKRHEGTQIEQITLKSTLDVLCHVFTEPLPSPSARPPKKHLCHRLIKRNGQTTRVHPLTIKQSTSVPIYQSQKQGRMQLVLPKQTDDRTTLEF